MAPESSAPIVPWVLVINPRLKPYQAPTLDRAEVISETYQQLRLKGRSNVAKHKAYCIPDDAAWDKVVQLRDAFQQTLTELANHLRSLGSYATRLKEAGGITQAPNPLTSTAIQADDPDESRDSERPAWFVPDVQRRSVLKHTPHLLRYQLQIEQTNSQSGFFVCPDHDAWVKTTELRAQAQAAASELEAYLIDLSTYAIAAFSKKYAPKVGDQIVTSSGTATITEIEQAGNAPILHAKYGDGAGVSQPHTMEAVSQILPSAPTMPHEEEESNEGENEAYPRSKSRFREGDRLRITAVQPHQSTDWIGKVGTFAKISRDRVWIKVSGNGDRMIELPLPFDCVVHESSPPSLGLPSDPDELKPGDRVRILQYVRYQGSPATVVMVDGSSIEVIPDGGIYSFTIAARCIERLQPEPAQELAGQGKNATRVQTTLPVPAAEAQTPAIAVEVMLSDDQITGLYRELLDTEQQTNNLIQSTTEKYYQLGIALLHRRPEFKRGEWLPWLERRGIQERRAQRAMQIAKHFGPDTNHLSLFTIDNALSQVQQKLPHVDRYTFDEIKEVYDAIEPGAFKRCRGGTAQYSFEVPGWSKAFDSLHEAWSFRDYVKAKWEQIKDLREQRSTTSRQTAVVEFGLGANGLARRCDRCHFCNVDGDTWYCQRHQQAYTPAENPAPRCEHYALEKPTDDADLIAPDHPPTAAAVMSSFTSGPVSTAHIPDSIEVPRDEVEPDLQPIYIPTTQTPQPTLEQNLHEVSELIGKEETIRLKKGIEAAIEKLGPIAVTLLALEQCSYEDLLQVRECLSHQMDILDDGQLP